MASTVPSSATLEGLPKKFVSVLRTLFDILDDKGSGFVQLADIEYRWQDDGTKGLPKGVIESLRKVTPANGLLSFERFCAGLKICLLRNQMERSRGGGGGGEGSRPPSAPLLDMESGKGGQGGPSGPPWGGPPISHGARTVSMPQLAAYPPPLYGPPKPPRVLAPPAPHPSDKEEIRSALYNWQMGVMMGHRTMGDGNPTKKVVASRRREPRRHTLQNGVDYNMFKRIKQIEMEKEVLSQGLEAVERAREWYLKQISALQDKVRSGGEAWSEAQEERIELQRARILEVNRQLGTLTGGGSLPLHMNLAVLTPQVVARLRQENCLLSQENSSKSERISKLEREKASLIRELLSHRVQPVPAKF